MTPDVRPIDHVLNGNGVALIDRAGAMTFAEVEAAVARLAGWLAELGLKAGARVASWLPKTREACLLPLAVPRAGLVHVPVNPALRRAQVAHILGDSGAALLVTQEARAATLGMGDVAADCRVITSLGEGAPLGPSTADPALLAAILYTSGSTGRAKGVMLSPCEPVARGGVGGLVPEAFSGGPSARGAAAGVRLRAEPAVLELVRGGRRGAARLFGAARCGESGRAGRGRRRSPGCRRCGCNCSRRSGRPRPRSSG